MELRNVKGTFDYMPEDMVIRNKIMMVLKNGFERYGYLPLESSIVNYYSLLSYKYDDNAEILSEIYRLTDQGERDLGLRYDLTVPFCKIVGRSKNLTLPFRRYEIGKVFRNGPVKTGRMREFYQCDVDVVGIDNRYIEAEQILMAIDIYKELGIDVIVKYNNRKLMSAIILSLEIDDDLIDSVIGVIDKLEKVSNDEFRLLLEDIGLSDMVIDRLFSMFKMTLDDYRKIDLDNYSSKVKDLFAEALGELTELEEYLEQLNVNNRCVFTPTLARGLSIYTGVVFEFYDECNRLNCAIGGGGRYDKIITNFVSNGINYPACGLSFGLEPLFVLLMENNQKESLIDIYIVPFGDIEERVTAIKVANKFRSLGYRVLIEMNDKKIKKCFEYADRENIKYVMVIGSEEISSKRYKIKNMQEKKEYIDSLEGIVKYLK